MRISTRFVLSCLVGLIALAQSKQSQAAITYDYNFSGASGGAIADLLGVREGQFLAGSILGFHDLDASGGISTGDTFTDFTMLKFTGFTDAASNDITPAAYGSQATDTHEITLKTSFSGVQIAPNQYVLTSIDLFEVYFDSGAGFTGSTFTDLNTFEDGTLVETGVLGGPSGGNNLGPTAPDGSLDVVVRLFDALHLAIDGEYFEYDSVTGDPLDTFGNVVLLGLFDANNELSPPAPFSGALNGGDVIQLVPTVVGGGFADVFAGLSGTQAPGGAITSLTGFDFGFATRSDGSFEKDVIIPEPGAVLVWGILASLGVGSVCYKRRRMDAK